MLVDWAMLVLEEEEDRHKVGWLREVFCFSHVARICETEAWFIGD